MAQQRVPDGVVERWAGIPAHWTDPGIDLRSLTSDFAADLRDARRELAAKDAEIAQLNEALNSWTEECICGCPLSQHESYEEGESCGNDDHECLRACPAVGKMYRAVQQQLGEARTVVRAVADLKRLRDRLFIRTAPLRVETNRQSYIKLRQEVDLVIAALDAARAEGIVK